MLSHGSSIFGVIPLVVLALWRGFPSWRWVGAAILGGLALMGPWVAYQHYADPPGNRLLKWQLGGDIEIDSKGTLEAIEDGYSEVGFDGALDLKEENFGEMVGWPRGKEEYEAAIDALEEGKPGIAAAKVRGLRFFSLLPFLGILLIAPLAMVLARLRRIRHDDEEWRFALDCFVFLLVACICWGLLLFGTPESRTTIHVGSLAVPLLGLVGLRRRPALLLPALRGLGGRPQRADGPGPLHAIARTGPGHQLLADRGAARVRQFGRLRLPWHSAAPGMRIVPPRCAPRRRGCRAEPALQAR